MLNQFYWILFFLLVTSPITVNCQESLKIKCDSIYSSDLVLGDKIIAIHQSLIDVDTLAPTEELGYTYHRLGLLHSRNKEYDKAIEQTLKAVSIRESLPKDIRKHLNNSLFNVYANYTKLDKAETGVYVLEKIIKGNTRDKYYARAIEILASISADRGDYFGALEYLKTEIASSSLYENPDVISSLHATCIYVYSLMDDPIEYLDKIDMHKEKIEKLLSTDDHRLANMYNNLGNIFFYSNTNYKRAKDYFEKALPVYIEIKDSNSLGTVYNNLGATHSILNKNEKANSYYKKGLLVTNDVETTADIYNNQGFYLKTEDPKERIKYYQKSITTILEQNEEFQELNEIPSFSIIKNSIYRVDALHYLGNIAKAWVDAFANENKQVYLNYAKKTLYLIDQIVSLIRLDSQSDASKLFWINKGVDPYMLAVKVCFLLNDPYEGFYLMEKNKSLLLLEHLNDVQAKSKLGVPNKMLRKEADLRYKTSNLKEAIEKFPHKIALQKQLIDLKNELISFQDSLKSQFPNYYNNKKELQILSLKEAKETYVNKEKNLIEYILNDKMGYGIFCSSERTLFFEIKNVPELLKQVKSLKQQLSKPFTTKAAFKKYNKAAYIVFQRLFPFDVMPLISNKKLTIISDYELHNLPFSALVIADYKDGINLDYLLKYSEVSYLQSTSVFQHIKRTVTQANTSIIGFSPAIFKNDSLPDLLLSEQEMKKYAPFLSMDLRTREQATKASFIESLNYASIVHLSTHAGYDKSNTPWLSFFDQDISLNELYSFENSTNMIILDACKSAAGKMEMGEGIMSLSRAFFYGGTQSVLASNWNVNEKSNSKILHTFYKNLEEGKTKSSALHKTKLDFLKSAQLEQTSPYFWASMTLTGNTKPLQLSSNSPWTKIILVASLIIVVFLFFLKFRPTLFK